MEDPPRRRPAGSYLLLTVAALPLHGLHQLDQPIHEGLLGGQEGAHHTDTLISLRTSGSQPGRLAQLNITLPAGRTHLEQSLAKPPHDVQVHVVRLGVPLLGVLILAFHYHIPDDMHTHVNCSSPRDARAGA